MSGSFNNLLFKYNTLATQILLISKSLFQFVTLNTIQTITSLKIFVVPPKTNFPPVSPNDLVNKQYVDSLVPTPISAVLIDGSQTVGTGIKTFTNLPQSVAVPTDPKDFVTKAYVDTQKVFQKRILNATFSGNIDTLIQLDSPVLGLCQISGRIELLPNQNINIGDIFLKIEDGSTVLANSLSQVNFQGLVAGELATAQISCMDVISTNAQMTFTLSNIVGTTPPYGNYSLFLDIIKM